MHLEEPEARARALVEPYCAREGVIGAYLVGSATRPYRDDLSDLDIELVVDDEVYERMPDAERHVLVIDEGPPRRVDHEFYAWSCSAFRALLASTQDLFHQPYQHAVVLHDPSGGIRETVDALAALPANVREDRMRVHFLELLFGAGRAKKTWARGEETSARLVAAGALAAAAKLLFLTKGSWASPLHWTVPELRLLGVPEDLLAAFAGAVADPSPEDLGALVTATRHWLAVEGETLQEDLEALSAWAFHREEGRAAFERWGDA